VTTTVDGASQAVTEASSAEEKKQTNETETLGFLNEMQENVGQISELAKEEENLVKEFFSSLLKILEPFTTTLRISASSLPKSYGERVSTAHLHLTGELILVCKNGDMEILNLTERRNHEVLTGIAGDIMANLKSIITSCKTETEKRVKFLMTVTKELQKIAKALSDQ